MITFRDDAMQKKHGRELNRLLQKHLTKLELLEGSRTDLPSELTEEELESLIEMGERTYWSVKRDKNGKAISITPYTTSTVCRKLHKKANKERMMDDIFYDFNDRARLI